MKANNCLHTRRNTRSVTMSMIGVFLLIALLLTTLSPAAFAAESEPVTISFSTVLPDEVFVGNFGYEILETEGQKDAYAAVATGVFNLKEKIVFQVDATNEDIREIICNLPNDFPEFFYFTGAGKVYMDESGSFVVEPLYELNGKSGSDLSMKEIQLALLRYEAEITSVIDNIPINYRTPVDTAWYLHNYVADRITYEFGQNHQNAYGALVDGRAVCTAYARLYADLLNRCGIRCWTITGKVGDGGHAWNVLWLNGECFYTDVCYDDKEDYTTFKYFLLSGIEMSETHKPLEKYERVLGACEHCCADKPEATRVINAYQKTGYFTSEIYYKDYYQVIDFGPGYCTSMQYNYPDLSGVFGIDGQYSESVTMDGETYSESIGTSVSQ